MGKNERIGEIWDIELVEIDLHDHIGLCIEDGAMHVLLLDEGDPKCNGFKFETQEAFSVFINDCISHLNKWQRG